MPSLAGLVSPVTDWLLSGNADRGGVLQGRIAAGKVLNDLDGRTQIALQRPSGTGATGSVVDALTLAICVGFIVLTYADPSGAVIDTGYAADATAVASRIADTGLAITRATPAKVLTTGTPLQFAQTAAVRVAQSGARRVVSACTDLRAVVCIDTERVAAVTILLAKRARRAGLDAEAIPVICGGDQVCSSHLHRRLPFMS